MKVIILISADVEWQAILPLHPGVKINTSPLGEWFEDQIEVDECIESIRYFHGGWGKIAAAASTQYVIDHWEPDLLINLGTCGGIEGVIKKGEICLITSTIVYDIIEQMGDQDEAIAYYSTDLDLSWLGDNYPIPVEKTAIVTGDRDLLVEDIPYLKDHFGARVGDWESGAIAFVASRNKVPLIILRGVSDMVGNEGGEAYSHFRIFEQTARTIMQALDLSISRWIEKAGML